jgi:hypothetical protein
MIDLDAARTFVLREGRILDSRLFAAMFDGGPSGSVLDAMLAYRNSDGGFGHGMETDKVAPTSQPLDVEIAFEVMDLAGCVEPAVVAQACDFLAASADDTGLVPLVFDDMLDYPHAVHWDEIPRTAGVNPTGGLAAFLWKWGVDHPWRTAATAGLWKSLEDELPAEVHALREALRFLERQPDRGRAEALVPAIGELLPRLPMMQLEPGATEYGLTPLHLAPEPGSPWRRLFDDELIEAFLDDLEGQQQPDGGWPITWEPPGQAGVSAWRARVTIDALDTLRAAGRLPG